MIRVTNELLIPENEITFTASRSGGPGGQNVNKVSSRVTLSFDVWDSTALSEAQKQKVASKLVTRINKDGVLRIISQRTRSQEMNRTDALERFVDLLKHALTPERPRIKTRMPAGAKERRMEEKKKRRVIKETRSKKGWDS
ncbi:MAG: aminoacyl-tRNA hydrolase [Acidobacteria bacterium]|nr:MAG: aminoacyl-tRNA hydrolase [Acidobacteriota bacterium]